jgi:hypothetical protein
MVIGVGVVIVMDGVAVGFMTDRVVMGVGITTLAGPVVDCVG